MERRGLKYTKIYSVKTNIYTSPHLNIYYVNLKHLKQIYNQTFDMHININPSTPSLLKIYIVKLKQSVKTKATHIVSGRK